MSAPATTYIAALNTAPVSPVFAFLLTILAVRAGVRLLGLLLPLLASLAAAIIILAR